MIDLLNLHLNMEQHFAVDTKEIYFPLEKCRIDSFLNRTNQSTIVIPQLF